MRYVSAKRSKENIIYRNTKKDLFLGDLKLGKLVCFFTQKKITIPVELRYEDDDTLMKYLTCHHLNQERENERLFDKEMMVPVLDKYHMDYHSFSVSQLLQTDWYSGFLFRLKEKAPDVYKKEINKQLKAGIITIEEYERKTS